jgi:hypothetical protein
VVSDHVGRPLTGLVGEQSQNRLSRGPKNAGRCSRGRLCPAAARECGGYDSIRERVGLVLFLHGQILANDGSSERSRFKLWTQKGSANVLQATVISSV